MKHPEKLKKKLSKEIPITTDEKRLGVIFKLRGRRGDKILEDKGVRAILMFADITPEGIILVSQKEIVNRAEAAGYKVAPTAISSALYDLEVNGIKVLRQKVSSKKAVVSIIEPRYLKGRRISNSSKAKLAILNFAERGPRREFIVDTKDIAQKSKNTPFETTSASVNYAFHAMKEQGFNLKRKTRFGVEREKTVPITAPARATPKSDRELIKTLIMDGLSNEKILSYFSEENKHYWQILIEEERMNLEEQ